MAAHSSTLAWEIPQRSLVGYSPWGRKRVRHDWATKTTTMRQQGGEGTASCPKADSPTDNQRTRAFTNKGRGLHTETAQSALTVILNLVISGLTSVILIIWGTVNLQLRGQFVPVSVRPVLRTVAVYCSLQSGHHVSIRHLLGWDSSIIYSSWEGIRGPWLCLPTKLSSFCLLW